MNDDISCPRCKTTKYRNPSLKLFVNTCGHGLCENCVEQLFVRGSGVCPQCNARLRRTDFRIQLFEDSFVEKEIDIRRRVLKDFNKKEDDFNTLHEYNDYLELVETIIFNLTNNIKVDETKKQIETYRKENEEIIVKNRNKLSHDEEFLETVIEQENEEKARREKMSFYDKEDEISKTKKRQKEALVDELMFSDLPADQILATHATNVKDEDEKMNVQSVKPLPVIPTASSIASKNKYFSTGIKLGKGSNVFMPIPRSVEGQAYEYIEPELILNGPVCPKFDDLEADGYLLHVKTASESEKASGFLTQYPCFRAIQEAFSGLYFKSENK